MTKLAVIGESGWMQTYEGIRFEITAPTEDMISIIDIAHALSMQCRYNGHTKYFYSTAEHSVLLSHCVPYQHRFWALMHDAAEAYVGDVLRPIKKVIPEFSEYENLIMEKIKNKYGLSKTMPRCVKMADTSILVDERNQLMGRPPSPWFIDEDVKPLGVQIECWQPIEAKNEFLKRFGQLNNGFCDGRAELR